MPGKFKETAYLPTQELQEFVERSAAQQGMSKSKYLGSLVEKEAASMSGKSSQPTLVLPKPYYTEIQFTCGNVFNFDTQITPVSINKKVISHVEESVISSFRKIIRNRSKDNPEYIRNTCFVLLITFVKGSYKANKTGTVSGRYDLKFTLIRVSEKSG